MVRKKYKKNVEILDITVSAAFAAKLPVNIFTVYTLFCGNLANYELRAGRDDQLMREQSEPRKPA